MRFDEKIIDFHTHVFPDELASRALAQLTGTAEGIYAPHTDMTADGLLRAMREGGIDLSVVQPVVTKPSQTARINEWAAALNERPHLMSFGGIHPDTDDYRRDIDLVVSLGLKGLKFHAEFQHFDLDESRMLRIYDYAFSRGLIVLHHAGFDPCCEGRCRTSPRQFAAVAKAMRGGVLIAAHLGGARQWADVERYLPGTGVMIDTSMGFDYYGEAQFLRIARLLGCENLLFASDSPWSCSAREVERIQALDLPEEEKRLILSGNATRILRLDS